MIEIKDLSKSFVVVEDGKKKRITPLVDVNLRIEKGQKIGIVGASGEGKSTLSRIICGFDSPDGGVVSLEGESLFDPKGRYRRKLGVRIQMIPQNPYPTFDPLSRVGAAVEEALRVAKKAKNRKEAKLQCEKLFDKTSLDPGLMKRLVSQLSGGQVQRVAIARALALDPEMLIADEATSMLDIISQAEIVKVFDTLAREDGVAVLMISHDESLVRAFADKCYRLIGGHLEEIDLVGDNNEK